MLAITSQLLAFTATRVGTGVRNLVARPHLVRMFSCDWRRVSGVRYRAELFKRQAGTATISDRDHVGAEKAPLPIVLKRCQGQFGVPKIVPGTILRSGTCGAGCRAHTSLSPNSLDDNRGGSLSTDSGL
jgi:hypothetical protein